MLNSAVLLVVLQMIEPDAAAIIPDPPVLAPVHLAFEPGLADEDPIINFNLQTDDAVPSRYGEGGSTRFTLQGAVASHEVENYLFITGFGFEHFIDDDISLVTQFNGIYAQQVGHDTSAANVALLIRWHFISREHFSVYVESGAGMLFSNHSIPDKGTRFNFTPQAALGVMWDVGNENRVFMALGWHHISNANLYDLNPSRDSVILHVGMSFPF